MNAITNKISVDLMNPLEPAVIHAVQGEVNARNVEISVFCDGVPWTIPDGVYLMMRYGGVLHPGGSYDTLLNGACAYSYEGNTITFVLAPQMMASAGAVLAQVEMRQNDQTLVTFPFKVVVAMNPAVGSPEAEAYINWQQWLEQELDAYIKRVQESGELLGGTMAGPINMNGHKLGGLNAPAEYSDAATKGYTLELMKKASVQNLLDNSDFRNPVMQAGLNGLHGTQKYPIDRWISWNDDVVLGNGFIQIQSSLDQRIDNSKIDAAKNYTLALGLLDGTVLTYTGKIDVGFGTYSTMYAGRDENDQVFVRIGKTDPMVWAALYEGEYTSVTLPEYRPKGYSAELSACQRYYYYYNTDGNGVFFPCTAGITQIPGFLFPVAMRAVPTMTIKQLHTWTTVGFTDVSGFLSSLSCSAYGLKYIELTIAVEKNGLIFLEAEFSADL